MASKKTFKTPAKKTDFPRKVTVSLTDEQYEALFNAVINPSQHAIEIKSPTMADSPGNKAKSPKESASVETSQNSQHEKQIVVAKPAKSADTSTLSTINTEEFIKNAFFSTPDAIKKPRTFRTALCNMKSKMDDSLNSSILDLIGEGPLSQPPSHLSRRERLLWLQERRGTGLYVKCDDSKCAKWRWLDIADPIDVPHEWFCSMNPDKEFASCSIPEKPIPLYVEDDLIHNCYTAGSIVWAKMIGYPWWPAMVDDCPDCEQYYWINNELYDVPNWYNVVFFDANNVSRRWVLAKDIKSFKHSPNFDKKFKIKQMYKRRMAVAKQKASTALLLHVKDRLKQYSFVSLWEGDLPEYNDIELEDSDIEENDPKYDRVIKKKIIMRRKALMSSQESSSSDKALTIRINQNENTVLDTLSQESNASSNISFNTSLTCGKSKKAVSNNLAQDNQDKPSTSFNNIQPRRMSQNGRRKSVVESNNKTGNSKKTDKKSKETVSNNLAQDNQDKPSTSFNNIQPRRMSQNGRRKSVVESNNKTGNSKKTDKKSKETVSNNLAQDNQDKPSTSFNNIQPRRMSQNSRRKSVVESNNKTGNSKKTDKKSKETVSNNLTQENRDTSSASFNKIQSRRISQNSRHNSLKESTNKTEKAVIVSNTFSQENNESSSSRKKQTRNNKTEKTIVSKTLSQESNESISLHRMVTRRMSQNSIRNSISSQESNKSSISSTGVQTRRMSLNSQLNSQTEIYDDNKTEKSIKAVANNKKTPKTTTKPKKISNKIASRRNTMHYEVKKIDLPRRKSEGTLKQKQSLKVDNEFIKELTARCSDLIENKKMDQNKYDTLFKEVYAESSSSEKTVNMPVKRSRKRSSASSNIREERSTNEENSRKRKLNNEQVAPSKMDAIIKKKKTFMPPVKKNNMNTSSSASAGSDSKFHGPLFEDN